MANILKSRHRDDLAPPLVLPRATPLPGGRCNLAAITVLDVAELRMRDCTVIWWRGKITGLVWCRKRLEPAKLYCLQSGSRPRWRCWPCWRWPDQRPMSDWSGRFCWQFSGQWWPLRGGANSAEGMAAAWRSAAAGG